MIASISMIKIMFRKFIVALVLLSMAAAKDVPSLNEGFTEKEKQSMIDLHNEYRARVARGEEPNQPQAADMIAMEWDDRLVESAQKWSTTCKGWHNTNEERRFEPYSFTGQNYAGNLGMLGAVRAWYDEVTEGNFVFDGLGCSSVCGHYTQVVWSKTHLIGCAQHRCTSKGEHQGNVYCDYAPGANTQFDNKKDPVYLTGEPCSKCPAGFGFCMDGALCASKRACENSDSKCECSITSCDNGGTLDEAKCECACPSEYEGLKCDVPCKDDIDYCDGYSAECSWNANMWMWIGRVCRKFCGKCGPFKDSGLRNAGGIKTNVNKGSGGQGKGAVKKSDDKKPGNTSKPKKKKMRKKKRPRQKKKKNGNRQRNQNKEKQKTSGGDNGKQKPAKVSNKKQSVGKNGGCQNLYTADSACEGWVSAGACDQRKDYMMEVCEKACGCAGAGCKNTYDADGACDAFAERGDCETNPGWITQNCARSCGTCL